MTWIRAPPQAPGTDRPTLGRNRVGRSSMRATEAFLQRNLFHLAAHPTGISRRSFSVKINNFFAKIQFTIFAFPCFIHGIRTSLKYRIPCLTRIPRFFLTIMIKPGRLCQLLSWARIEYSLLGAHPYNLPGRSLTLHTYAWSRIFSRLVAHS